MRPPVLGLVAILVVDAAAHAGAYGHWRWREWVFGGATDYVLRRATVPVLVMH